MRPFIFLLLSLSFTAGACYSGRRTSRDINKAWQGQKSEQIVSEWGTPKLGTDAGGGTIMTWSHTHTHFSLPSIQADLRVTPDRIDAYGEVRTGETWKTSTSVRAIISNGVIVDVKGPSIRWGAPPDINLRWGLLFGAHAGMGRLDDTSSSLPSGGLYIGGMLSRTVGLVGSYSLAAGSDDEGGALGMSWALGPQWWPQSRLSLRAGPAMILAFDPGFNNVGLEPGVNGAVSYGVVRSGNFVLDIRLDLNAGTGTQFASLGIGVNLN